MGRRFSLTLHATKGKMLEFAATIGGRVVISGDGSRAWTYSTDELPNEPVEVRVFATGVAGAEYAIAGALPGIEQGFVWRHTLSATVQSVAFQV